MVEAVSSIFSQGGEELGADLLPPPAVLFVAELPGDRLGEHDQVEVTAVERVAESGRPVELGPPARFTVAREERLILPDVPEQRQGDEVGEGVAPEHPLAVDESADTGCSVRAVDQDVALPQVEVDGTRDGDLVQGRVRRPGRAGDVVGGERQPCLVAAGVVEDGVVERGERGAPVGGEGPEGAGGVAEAGAGDLVQPGELAPQLRPQVGDFGGGEGVVPGVARTQRHQEGVAVEDHHARRRHPGLGGGAVEVGLGDEELALVR